jgi:hypothetical protein
VHSAYKRPINDAWAKLMRLLGYNSLPFEFSDIFGSISSEDDIEVYVDSTNGNDAHPGTQVEPLKTLLAALRKVPHSWQKKCRINLTAGSYSIPDQTIVRYGGGYGINAEPLAIVGTMTDSGLGSRVATGGTSGATFTIEDTTLAMTANQYQGFYIRMTSGAAIGERYQIASNTATQFKVVSHKSVPTFASSNTFVVEQPGSVITHQGNSTWTPGTGVPAVSLVFANVKHVLTSGKSLRFTSGARVLFSGVHVDCGGGVGGTLSIRDGGRLYTNYSVSSFALLDLPIGILSDLVTGQDAAGTFFANATNNARLADP